MKNLLLLRHAKSCWENLSLVDFQRPLNDRGREAAQRMAAYLGDHMPLPDHVVCSTAQRTRETLSALVNVYAHDYQLDFRRDLYMPTPTRLMGVIQASDPEVETLMIVSHNPGLEELACVLSKDPRGEQMQDMLTKYPTAACAHFRFEAEDWTDVKIGQGHLVKFIKPRALD